MTFIKNTPVSQTQIVNGNTVKFTQIGWALPMGEYAPTSIDAEKQTVDFRLMQVCPNYIRWADGRSEIVSAAKLKKLQANHTWATDF